MVSSDFRPEVEIRPFRACAMKNLQYNLKRSVDKSTERKEVGRMFQILAPATAKLRSPSVDQTRGL